jgi:hypothetical protein
MGIIVGYILTDPFFGFDLMEMLVGKVVQSAFIVTEKSITTGFPDRATTVPLELFSDVPS